MATESATENEGEVRSGRGVVLVLLVATAIIAGYFALGMPGMDHSAGTMTGTADPSQRASPADPGVAHVHGLGVNPGDADLYVATHTGTFRIPDDGPAERLGGTYQDTMGFTIAGADRFLGSGHPDVPALSRGDPPRLGLIESTDAGQSWHSRSLRGESDFHALAFIHEQVYGLDSTTGRFMVSTDLANWEIRSTVEILAFVVDPADPDQIVSTSSEGLLRSVDGGRQWAAQDGPGLLVLAWDTDMGLWGVGPDGAVHRSLDAGQTWEQTGRLPGQPEALLAQDGVLYTAAVEDDMTGIYRSDDEGSIWRLSYRDEP